MYSLSTIKPGNLVMWSQTSFSEILSYFILAVRYCIVIHICTWERLWQILIFGGRLVDPQSAKFKFLAKFSSYNIICSRKNNKLLIVIKFYFSFVLYTL